VESLQRKNIWKEKNNGGNMFAKDIGIDLGTANVLIYIRGQGIVLNEPSVVAIDTETKKALAVGTKAREMLGRTPGKVEAIRPMKDGVIADFDLTEIMLDHFIKEVNGKGFISKPRILICCPSNITQVEKNAIKEAAERTGARKVFLEEEPKVAAIGAGMDISKPSGNMVIDIGGGTTDIAVLSLGDIVTSSSIKIAGNVFDSDIEKYIKNKYKLLIGDRTAEEIKFKIGTVYTGTKKEKLTVRGRDLVTGLPHTITICSDEIEEALRESAYIIVHTAKSVLEKTPPELSADIIDKGIVITGGGALINGIDKLLAQELKVPVVIAESPLTCVAEGTGIMLNNLSLIDK
jgi:rod shape-determining protein MreB